MTKTTSLFLFLVITILITSSLVSENAFAEEKKKIKSIKDDSGERANLQIQIDNLKFAIKEQGVKLQTQIDSFFDVFTEISKLYNVDSFFDVFTEIKTTDESLQTQINNEAAARKVADEKLGIAIDEPGAQLQKQIDDLQNQINELKSKIDSFTIKQ